MEQISDVGKRGNGGRWNGGWGVVPTNETVEEGYESQLAVNGSYVKWRLLCVVLASFGGGVIVTLMLSIGLRGDNQLVRPQHALDRPLESVEYVDILRGVAPTSPAWSYGNALPIHALPRGTAHWSVTTEKHLDEKWFVDTNNVKFVGVRATHLPSPWMHDYGHFNVRPSIPTLSDPTVWLTGNKAVLKPHHLNLTITSYCSGQGCTQFEFSPSLHGGMFSMRTPPGLPGHARNLIFQLPRGRSSITSLPGSTEITGVSKESGTMSSYVAMTFGNHISAVVEWPEGVDGKVVCEPPRCSFAWNGTLQGETVRVRVGNSLISLEQAILNRKREVDIYPTIEAMVESGKNVWNSYLDRVQIHGLTKDTVGAKQKLFTSLYRALLWPRDLAELDADNNTVHWSPYNGKVAEGHIMTDSGFWDAYRALYPMLQLVYPEVAKDILSGWINAIRETGGKIPEWPNPGAADMMEGTMSDCTMSDAIVTGLINGDEADVVYEELLRNAFNMTSSSRGRSFKEYLQLGYIPRHVSLSQNHYLADWAIAQAAEFRGDHETARKLLERSKNWTRLFNPGTGFFQSKNALGYFEQTKSTFDEFEFFLRGAYTEGSAWQYRFYVPHDPKGLSEVYAKTGDDMCSVLHKALTITPAFHGVHIQDAPSMGEFSFGEYCHANQPVHHVLYMFAHANGCALEGQKWIQKAIRTFYGKFGYAGDEDNGEQSSWLVLSALGLYQLAPGNGKYQVGAPPLFPKTVIQRPPELGGELTILRDESLPTTEGFYQATKIDFDGVEWDLTNHESPPAFSYAQLLKGGTLTFRK
uniref:Alpha-1,2-mannosidase n=1 Tax=Mucochytrium quahogii TaxID=96639 RepID=A0A7S2WCK6_9STRA|mmetsp:Transcript_4774/g.7194  ORF Transcript_4774/g.7194 Transcript_4774/m.7194 type:complete len:809 (+) Transcript_4774:316-2742(+)|eukprot:CAMPEP_0203769242 /NCGR_PEP_ID=MMETSP0099_2-20121227/2074_1 /ASSEMBLY_ACC=CAM_ASM_000209 /TAXON_ID=96639 /ORGANISM=" , Strain NY0313808BC1" /LENGTH=808 /DNA_ID=CAMNT_0050666101 /DNA_START=298 /DNA_END=2724 /DNA_ORIENTATION=-